MAAEAGVSPSTLSHRLDKALESLRHRLSGGGVAGIGVAATAATLLEAERTSAAVPASLTANVVKIGLSAAGAAIAGSKVGILLKLAMLGALAMVAIVALAGWIRWSRASPAVATAPMQRAGAAPLANTAITLPPTLAAVAPPQWHAAPPPATAAVFSGRVLDRQGNPIAYARVDLDIVQSTHTDASGNYSFATLANSGTYHIGVESDGFISLEMYDPPTTPIALTPTSRTRRDIMLDRGVRLTVNVKNGMDEPIPDAELLSGRSSAGRGPPGI